MTKEIKKILYGHGNIMFKIGKQEDSNSFVSWSVKMPNEVGFRHHNYWRWIFERYSILHINR